MLYSSHCLLLSSLFLLGASAAQDAGAHSAIQPHHDHDAVVDISPDVHSHTSHSSHHSEPLVQLNETDVLRSNGPDPLSYWAHDFEATDDDHDSKNWRGLMGLHVVGMTLAFFVLLPAGKRSYIIGLEPRSESILNSNLVTFCPTSMAYCRSCRLQSRGFLQFRHRFAVQKVDRRLVRL